MKILGLTCEGDSGAAVAEDGRILAAVNEERLCRMKLVIGFPRLAIREVLELSQTEVGQLDAVLVASTSDLLADRLEPFEGWFQHQPGGLSGLLKTHGASAFSRFGAAIPQLQSAYYAMLAPGFWHRRGAIRRILRREFHVRCSIGFVDHHLAHAASAYYTSGLGDALVVSVDGGGDGRSAAVYGVRGGQFRQLHDVSAYHSLGNYYAYATHLCGFKAMKHEGKVTGLAAHGEPRYVPVLERFIAEEGGTFINRGRRVNLAAIRRIAQALPAGWTREDLAASIQRHCEALSRRFVRHWARHAGLGDVALAGGVFANVRVNQEIHDLPEIDRVFIHPHMGDGGLAVGAALAACIPGVLDHAMPADKAPLGDVYLGRSLDDNEIDVVLARHGLRQERFSGPLEEAVAELLAEGHVVARAAGRMEYGPRALGNRSILYQPTDRSVNDWLNARLARTEFMPFAPAALEEHRHRLFERLDGAEHAAEFMTVTFPCTAWTREHLRGVVHVDGTARPQLVRPDRNPEFYAILEAFRRRTGLPAVINTSFNMHEEPIVCSADDCVRAFLEGHVDYLAIGRRLVRHPRPADHPMHPVRRTPRGDGRLWTGITP